MCERQRERGEVVAHTKKLKKMYLNSRLAFVSLFTYYLNMYMAYKRSEWFNADDTNVEPSST